MQIVIDIPEELYEEIISRDDCGLHELTRAIANGTPLPKGHGELKDVDEIWRLYDHTDIDYTMIDALNDAPTIIEADKESEDKK